MRTALLALTISSCNQVVLDQIYKSICMQATEYDVSDVEAAYRAMETKHSLLDTLKKLCNGQQSTYERGK